MIIDIRKNFRWRMNKSRCYCVMLSGMLLINLATPFAQARNDETEQQINTSLQQNLLSVEQRQTSNIPQMNTDNILVLNGEKFKVDNNANDVGIALYLSINHQQWEKVRHYLSIYQTFPDRDDMLVKFAEGELARQGGDFNQAEKSFKAILMKQPDFTLVSLELARVYFEDQKNREANEIFNRLLSDGRTLSDPVRKNIVAFQQALVLRDSWHGWLSFGYLYNDNINQSPDRPPELLGTDIFGREVYRDTGRAVKAGGSSYDLGLNRRWQLAGYHGLTLQGTAYGENYPGYKKQNENSVSLSGGYSFKNHHDEVMAGLLYDYDAVGGKQRFYATGLKAEWKHVYSPQFISSLELNHKKLFYEEAYQSYDGKMTLLFGTFYWSPDRQTTWFFGADSVKRDTQRQDESYWQNGVRGGVIREIIPGITGIASATYRYRRYGEYSDILGGLREDKEQIYRAQLKIPAWEFLSLTPSITYRFRKNDSTIDWLYGYRSQDIMLRLETSF